VNRSVLELVFTPISFNYTAFDLIKLPY
jgi:hypothetical protein